MVGTLDFLVVVVVVVVLVVVGVAGCVVVLVVLDEVALELSASGVVSVVVLVSSGKSACLVTFAQLNEKSADSCIVLISGILYSVKLTGMMLLGLVKLNVNVPLFPEVIVGPTDCPPIDMDAI